MVKNKMIVQSDVRPVIQNRKGFVLVYSLIFLIITIMCGSFLMGSLSDRDARFRLEQHSLMSEWLADSGWNLGLQHLQDGNGSDNLFMDLDNGRVEVRINPYGENIYQIISTGFAGECSDTVSGVVKVIYPEKNESDEDADEDENRLETRPDDIITDEMLTLEVLSRTIG